MQNGRITALSHLPDFTKLTLRSSSGTLSFQIRRNEALQIGDLIGVELGENPPVAKILTRTLRPGASRFAERILDPRRMAAIHVRSQVEMGIRDFFLSRDFLETRTPLLVPCPGMETHIRPFRLETGAYLPTSPEFAMKRLLVGGLERIFQICPAFRYEPNSTTHHPEFTMLEWYRAYSNLEEIQVDTESLVESLALKIHGKAEIEYQGRKISVKTPWPRLRVRDLFENIGVNLAKATHVQDLRRECARLGVLTKEENTWDDLFFRIWLNLIEPNLPSDQAVFVERYPKSQAALAALDRDTDGSIWAKRFEFYIGGLELGNAFEELTDAHEQRNRFERDMRDRTTIYGSAFPPSPLDENFLSALEEGLPPSGGIAVGVDRLVMLLANESDIDQTVWLRSYPGPTEPDSVIG